MGDIRFIAEIFQSSEWPPELAIPSNLANGHGKANISEFDCSRPEYDTYWTTWGGTYDNPTTTNLQIFFGEFLLQVANASTLLSTENSFYANGDFVYLNTTYYPWQYITTDTEANISFGYSSAPVDPNYPSDNTIEDADGNKQSYPNYLQIPSITNKLSDPISGTALYSTFKFTLQNNDGQFDLSSDTNLFNTPVYIKKAIVDNPKQEDFTTVRYGLVSNIVADWTTLQITGEDLFRALDEDVCDTISTDDYPDAPDASIGKDIPVAFGSFSGVDLIEVGTDEYIVVDPDYLDTVSAVYDSDGTSLTFSVTSGVISATDADTCDFTASPSNNIGDMITKEMEEKSSLTYADGIWDVVETDAYISLANTLNLFYDGGTVKDFVKTCLESDNAFLITKNDGRLTLRQWGQIYQTHTIRPELITKTPSKTFTDRKYYGSTIKIYYDYNYETDEYDGTYIDDSKETYLKEKYRKSNTYEFETNLTTETEAIELAGRLLERFGARNEIFTIASGYDTSMVNLLDTVSLEIDINGRVMSDIKLWTVKEVNVTQDTMKLEQSTQTYYEFNDGLLSDPGDYDNDGLLSGLGVLASVPDTVEED